MKYIPVEEYLALVGDATRKLTGLSLFIHPHPVWVHILVAVALAMITQVVIMHLAVGSSCPLKATAVHDTVEATPHAGTLQPLAPDLFPSQDAV